MKPTVYLPLADLCPTGLRQSSTSSIAQFNAGRISMRRLWVEAEGKQVGSYDHKKDNAGGSRTTRSP
jgi:hypothetical protein